MISSSLRAFCRALARGFAAARRLHPEHLDAQPGGRLIWSGGGVFGAKRYACARHRDDLIAELRRHYGAAHSAVVWSHGPCRALWPGGFSAFDDRELEDLLARARHAVPDRADVPRPSS